MKSIIKNYLYRLSLFEFLSQLCRSGLKLLLSSVIPVKLPLRKQKTEIQSKSELSKPTRVVARSLGKTKPLSKREFPDEISKLQLNQYRSFSALQKDIFVNFLRRLSCFKGSSSEYILKKYLWHFVILILLILFSIADKFVPFFSKPKPKELSLDSLVPNGFVLMPIEISNGQDIKNIIGSYGVLDLYAYSKTTGLPETLVASALKVLPPSTEEGVFTALIPEKSAIYLFDYTEGFYAVVQNPQKTGSQVYKKQKSKSLIVIEENF